MTESNTKFYLFLHSHMFLYIFFSYLKNITIYLIAPNWSGSFQRMLLLLNKGETKALVELGVRNNY